VGIGSRQYEPRADLYSLGVVLYEALVGAPPFVAGNALALMARQASEDPIPPHQREPTVPAAISELALRLMAREPQRRPRDARAVVAAIEDLLIGRATGFATIEGEAVEVHHAFFDLTVDALTGIVRLARTPRAYERAEDAGAAYAAMRAAFPPEARASLALLIDTRAAPARTDPRFARIVAAELPVLMRGWRRAATLVRTEEGWAQTVAIRERAGLDPRSVFMDEDAALTWLLGTGE
jgi:hypothetical protein